MMERDSLAERREGKGERGRLCQMCSINVHVQKGVALKAAYHCYYSQFVIWYSSMYTRPAAEIMTG